MDLLVPSGGSAWWSWSDANEIKSPSNLETRKPILYLTLLIDYKKKLCLFASEFDLVDWPQAASRDELQIISDGHTVSIDR